MEKVKDFFKSAKKQFLLVQAMVFSMITTVAFCTEKSSSTNIFDNIDSKVAGYVESIGKLGLTCVAFFGVCSGILYISTSNERTAEKAKAWAIRCVVAIAAIILFQSARTEGGVLYDAINGLVTFK